MPNSYIGNYMNSKNFVENNYIKFCKLEGNEYIASEYVIYKIIEMLRKFNLRDFLELGAGIGTIADSVLNYSYLNNLRLNYVATEANKFCKAALIDNIDRYSDLKLFDKIENISRDSKFDFIIIDGSENLNLLKGLCKDRCIILIEGDRMDQTNKILSIFPKASYVHLTSLARKKGYAPGKKKVYQSGARLIFLNPDLSMKFYWLEHKIKTHFKRYFRNYKN